MSFIMGINMKKFPNMTNIETLKLPNLIEASRIIHLMIKALHQMSRFHSLKMQTGKNK